MGKSLAKPKFAATMMGAVPYRDMEKTARVILDNFPEAPALPAMTRGIKWMIEGIPCIVIDKERRMIFMDPPEKREAELLEFYEKYEQGDLDYFATSRQTGPFFHDMIDKIKEARPPELKWVVFHTGGPVLLGDTIRQLNGQPAIHHETMRDVIIKASNMKARWLEKKIKDEIPGVEVVADLPETTLVNFTSSSGTGTREAIVEAINQGFAGLDCLTWIHCCANIDWSLLTDTCVDVINFDAYAHSEILALYAKQVKGLLDRGGGIAWGIVPVMEDRLKDATVPSLVERLEKALDLFVEKGIDEQVLAESSWVIPSCETVLLTPEQSDRVLGMTREISEIMREKYGFKA